MPHRMNTNHWSRFILIILILFQAASGLVGGVALVMDPSGGNMQLPPDMLNQSPFSSFFIPGLILLLVLGIFPIFVFIGLVWRPPWKWANILNVYKNRYWGWTYALYIGIMLVIWITTQLFFIKDYHILHTIYAMLGVAIMIAALLPMVMDQYETR